MGTRFYRRFALLRGLRINVGKTGVSVSVGGRGANLTFGKDGVRATAGLPGTGVSHSETIPYSRSKSANPKAFSAVKLVLIIFIGVAAIALFIARF